MLIDDTSLDLWDTLTYLDRLILYPKSQKQASLGFPGGGRMISLVRGKRPEAPTVLWPMSSQQRLQHPGADGHSWQGFGFHWICSLARTECCVKTDSCLPTPHETQAEGAGASQCQLWGRWPYEKAPSHPLRAPFSRYVMTNVLHLPWTLGQNLRKVVLPPHLEDSFRVPNSFIGVLRDLQACFLPSLFSLEVLLGDFSGLNFYTCELSLVSLCIIPLNCIICMIQIIPCYHSLKFF